MIDSLNFGEYISYKLDGLSPTVRPLVTDNNTKYPYIIYRRANLISNSCKDGYYEDTVVIEFAACSDTYQGSIELIEGIRNALEHQEDTYEGLRITDSYVTSASEDYMSNAFVQHMQITFKLERI